MLEHLIVIVYDAPSVEVLLRFSMEPEVMSALGFQMTETRPVVALDEAMKLMK